jgi:hypothetical protein
MRRVIFLTAVLTGTMTAALAQSPASRPHNVVLFVADGLRFRSVDDATAPTMAALAREGVSLRNGHSLFPTFTTANASAMATGHMLGDTGDFSNTIYTGFQVPSVGKTVTPFLESDPVLADVDEHFSGNYLNEAAILKLARDQGFSTAAVGKVGPTLIFDHTERSGTQTIIVDDATGSPKGIPLSAEMTERLKAVSLPPAPPPRGASANYAGTTVANVVQQDYLAGVVTRAILPMFKERDKPFVLMFWSRDPDGTQHFQADSLNSLVPGINGPTSLAAIRNADDDLGRIRAALAELGLAETTDIIVTADHGFATISKESKTSPAAQARHPDAPAGHLPRGFLSFDLAKALGMPLMDPDNNFAVVPEGVHSRNGHGLIGGDKDHPKVVVAANSGSDLIYLPDGDRVLAGRVVDALLKQDYVSGLFVDERLGRFPGTLALADINLTGAAVPPKPAIVVNFRSFDTVCGEPVRCPVVVADTTPQQGQGTHGSFSRAETWNFMALAGPAFKSGFIDPAPASNADVARTVAAIMQLDFKDKGALTGRVLTEAMRGGVMPDVKGWSIVSEPAENGLRTALDLQAVGNIRYFDAGGFYGRTLGLSQASAPATR